MSTHSSNLSARTLALLKRIRLAIRAWRRTRPFWGAVWTALGGFLIFYFPIAPVSKFLHIGVGGQYGIVGGIVIMVMSLFLLFQPKQRHIVGFLVVMLGVASFPLSNLGGFFVGMFFSILGGSMAFGWMPQKPVKKWRRFRRIQSAEAALPAEAALAVAS
jgi:hypothetical protein